VTLKSINGLVNRVRLTCNRILIACRLLILTSIPFLFILLNMKTISLIAILSFVGLTLAASTNTTSSNSDAKVVRVASSKDFCLFLPPVSHTKKPADLGLDAKEATSVCSTGKTTFPSHLIKSAHYKKTKNYVQITGKLNVKGG
jgi:hypothetical protein